jgi:hypothetical protein
MDEKQLLKFKGITNEKRLLVLITERKHGYKRAAREKIYGDCLGSWRKSIACACGVCNPLQGEADVY